MSNISCACPIGKHTPFHVALEMFSLGGVKTHREWMAILSPPRDSESKGGTGACPQPG